MGLRWLLERGVQTVGAEGVAEVSIGLQHILKVLVNASGCEFAFN